EEEPDAARVPGEEGAQRREIPPRAVVHDVVEGRRWEEMLREMNDVEAGLLARLDDADEVRHGEPVKGVDAEAEQGRRRRHSVQVLETYWPGILWERHAD